MELMQDYKQTEVGIIPKDWEVRLLPSVMHFRSGKAHEKHISDNGEFICVNSKFISTSGRVRKYSSANFTPAKRNDVLMVMSDIPNGRALAKAYLAEKDDIYAVNQRICALTAYRDNPKYLFYILDRNPYFLSFNDGVNQTNLLNRVFQNCPIPLPKNTNEQNAIAEAISDVDSLLDGLDRLIKKKRHIKQAAMQDLLTGKRRLPGFEGKWEVKRLGDALKICHGRHQRDVEVPDGDYPILATGGQIGTADRPLYSKPSVLIGRKGTINKPQYMETPFWSVDTLFYSDLKSNCDAKFFYYLFCMIDWLKFNEASGVPSLNAKTIENIEASYPDLSEQLAIASVLSDIDNQISVIEARREKTRKLKQGIMQQLLTGKIRLT